MAYEILVGLEVLDNTQYSKYREAMMPILMEHEGEFTYDFQVSEVIKSNTKDNINRVFIISFVNEEKMNEFFSNRDYLLIKEKYFSTSVKSTTIISSYNKSDSKSSK